MKLRIISILLAICLALGLGTTALARGPEPIKTPKPAVANVAGIISSMDTGAKTVTITPSGGGSAVSLKVTDSTNIKVSGIKHATIADLKVGQQVEAKYRVMPAIGNTLSYNEALKIEAKRFQRVNIQGNLTQVTGVFPTTSVITITPEKGNPATLNVTADTKIEIVGIGRATFADLSVGRRAVAQYEIIPAIGNTPSYNKALKIEAKGFQRAMIQGNITQIAGSTITITPDKRNPATLNVTADTKIEIAGVGHASFADLSVGRRAVALYEIIPAVGSTPSYNKALTIEVKALQRANIQGNITQISGSLTTTATITVTPKEGNPVTLVVTANTKIEVEGKEHATFTDLQVGQRVDVLYQIVPATATKVSYNEALKIEAKALQQSNVQGQDLGNKNKKGGSGDNRGRR